MLRKMLIGGVIAIAALAGSAGTGHAGLNVDLGINFGFPPQLAPVPASPVFYAPSVSANLFSYDREFFVFRSGVWYVGPGHNGPWAELPPQYVPRPILAVPVRYYRERPREWAHGATRRRPGGRRRGDTGGRCGARSIARSLGMSVGVTVTRRTGTTGGNAPVRMS